MRIVRDTPQDNGIPEILSGIKDIKALEPIRGVYFLFLNDEIVYIGQSGNIYSRVQQHVRLKEKNFNKVFYQVIPKGIDILAVEKQYILQFRPKYNYETTARTCEPPTTTEDIAYHLNRIGRKDLRPDQVYLKHNWKQIERHCS